MYIQDRVNPILYLTRSEIFRSGVKLMHPVVFEQGVALQEQIKIIFINILVDGYNDMVSKCKDGVIILRGIKGEKSFEMDLESFIYFHQILVPATRLFENSEFSLSLSNSEEEIGEVLRYIFNEGTEPPVAIINYILKDMVRNNIPLEERRKYLCNFFSSLEITKLMSIGPKHLNNLIKGINECNLQDQITAHVRLNEKRIKYITERPRVEKRNILKANVGGIDFEAMPFCPFGSLSNPIERPESDQTQYEMPMLRVYQEIMPRIIEALPLEVFENGSLTPEL